MRVNRAWLGLALLMLPTFLVALDTTALLLALPRLSAALGADGNEQLWITDSYGFMVAGTCPSAGGAELLHTAREAFTASLHVTGSVAAVIFAGLVVLRSW
jgi:hypothetical protein